MTEATLPKLAIREIDDKLGTFVFRASEVKEPEAHPIATVFGSAYVHDFVRAVNAHDDLLAALETASKWLSDSWVLEFPGTDREAVVTQIAAALAKGRAE